MAAGAGARAHTGVEITLPTSCGIAVASDRDERDCTGTFSVSPHILVMAKTLIVGQEARKPNPALNQLTWLIGTWKTTGKHPMAPGTTFHGRTRFEWHEGGAFLAMRTEVEEKDIPSAIALIGSDDAEERLFMIYFDERGTSRHMAVTAGEGFIVWRRDFPAFRQIWTLTRVSKNKLFGSGRMQRNGEPWEDDLSQAFDRIAD